MTTKRISSIALLVAMGAALAAPLPSHAMSLSPMNVADLVRGSSDIVAGTVTAVRQGTAGNLPYTEIDLKVTDVVRGHAGRTLTFRRLGLQTSLAPVDGRVEVGHVPGFATFTVGEEVFLFLGPTSSRGFRAPVGLQQGKFSVGTGSVRNDLQNAGLFANVDLSSRALNEKEQAMVTTTQGALDSATFVGFVRRAVSQNWWPALGNADAPGPGPKKPGKKGGSVTTVQAAPKESLHAN
jgi:hypothetical protein